MALYRRAVTVKLALSVLPCASVAVAVTVVTPTGKADPDARPAVGDVVITGVIAPSTLSLAEVTKLTTAVVASRSVDWPILAGTVTTGGVVSGITSATHMPPERVKPCKQEAHSRVTVLNDAQSGGGVSLISFLAAVYVVPVRPVTSYA